jgi:aspartate-semialdehyde dehydrogenase
MATTEPSLRIVVVGATTLRGKELVQVLGERIPQAKLVLLDDEDFAGTLTEAAGEVAVIQIVDAESFLKAQVVFFAGEPESTLKFASVALTAGAAVIDMSGGLAGLSGATTRIPVLDSLLPVPQVKANASSRAISSPPATVQISCAFALALNAMSPESISIVFMQPASERGQQGIEELEHQTTKLLTFQPFGQNIFGLQAAFNLSDRFGDASKISLKDVRSAIARDVANYLSGWAGAPAVELLMAPTFHSHGFSVFVNFEDSWELMDIERVLVGAGFLVSGDNEGATNVSVAGEDRPVIGRIERDANHDRGFWFWGAADGLRVGALNAVTIAEQILKTQA